MFKQDRLIRSSQLNWSLWSNPFNFSQLFHYHSYNCQSGKWKIEQHWALDMNWKSMVKSVHKMKPFKWISDRFSVLLQFLMIWFCMRELTGRHVIVWLVFPYLGIVINGMEWVDFKKKILNRKFHLKHKIFFKFSKTTIYNLKKPGKYC